MPAGGSRDLAAADHGAGDGGGAGTQATVDVAPGDSLLEGALQLRSDAPYACWGGACGTCRAKLIEGEIEMDHNFALGRAELDAGYILTCQSHPTTPLVAVDDA